MDCILGGNVISISYRNIFKLSAISHMGQWVKGYVLWREGYYTAPVFALHAYEYMNIGTHGMLTNPIVLFPLISFT